MIGTFVIKELNISINRKLQILTLFRMGVVAFCDFPPVTSPNVAAVSPQKFVIFVVDPFAIEL